MRSEQQPQVSQQEQPPTEPPPKPAPVPKTFLRYSSKPAKDFFDKFRDDKLCTIPATSRFKKQDAFLAMRPKQGTCMDYRISETDTKLDAGTTKIHIRHVTATYEPLPPKPPEEEAPPTPKKRKRNPFHNKYCHARQPVYEFAEEIYARKVMRQQEFYKAKMQKRLARNKKEKKYQKYNEHEGILEFCGPDWFIELSPIQSKAIDNLKEAIRHDLRFGGLTETCYIIGRLGIVLRPNRKHVEIALKNSCNCPVEFLLTLYQLMNPNRTSYSLNDMLILSSVVHLTLKSTLKEMHIRLPSPPPPLERKIPKPKRPKKCTYESPYLEPVLYIRPKPTALETWKNRHLTFPRNPYFAYLQELHELKYPTFQARCKFRMSKEKISQKLESEPLLKELQAAQAAFNKMHEYYEHEPVQLLQASIYHTCNKQVQCTSSGLLFNQNNEDSDKEVDVTTTFIEPTSLALAIDLKITEEFDDNNNRTKTVYQCQVDTRVERGSQEQDNASSSSDSVPDCENNASVNKQIETEEEMCVCKVPSIKDCYQEIRNTIKDDDDLPKLIEIKNRTPSNCTCRQIIEKRIEESTCQCEKCKEDAERKNIKTTFVISDTKMEPDGPIPIISDVKAEKKCTCLERYMKRVNRIDYRKKIRRAHEHLIDMGQPFIVNGVAIGPDGKTIYNLSAGVAIKAKCPCLKNHFEPLSDRTKLANMPLGRQKYVISGVHATPEGNVFIISSVVPDEPCSCMKMYREYVKQHDPCMQLYKAYMNKVEQDTEEYMADLRNRNIDEDSSSSSTFSTLEDDDDADRPFEGGAPIGDEAEDPIIQVVNEPSDHGSGDHKYDENCFTLDIEFEKRSPQVGKRVCICKVEDEGENEPVEEKPIEPYFECEQTDYERYIILDRIPIDWTAQIEIIKRLLFKLSQDNYPLARLPDCHKLPIFKLWMAKRTYQYWTYDDRLSTLNKSKKIWNHILHCQAYLTKNLTLGVSNTDADNFTWLDAKMIKNYTSKRQNDYQRQQIQASVASAREFFSSLFMYENYSKRFRELYFAYMPSKEEDVLYHNVWKSHDFRNLIMNRLDAKVFRCSKLV